MFPVVLKPSSFRCVVVHIEELVLAIFKPVNEPDIVFQRTLTPVSASPAELLNPTYLHAIVRDKTQTNTWRYHSVFDRILYSRLKLTHIRGVLPKVS